MSAPISRKPWPMRWVVLAIVGFLVPYTVLTLKYRKTEKAYEPYADMKAEAVAIRLREAGWRRALLRLERPDLARPAREILWGAPAAPAATAPGGLPADLARALLDPPPIILAARDLIAPASIAAGSPVHIQFTAALTNEHVMPSRAEVFFRDREIVVLALTEPIPGDLVARQRETSLALTLPPGLFQPGEHTVLLAGANASLRWTIEVK